MRLPCVGSDQGAGSDRTSEQEWERDQAGELPDNLGGGTDGPSAGDVLICRPDPDHLRQVPTSLVTVHGNSRLLAKAVAGAVWRQDL